MVLGAFKNDWHYNFCFVHRNHLLNKRIHITLQVFPANVYALVPSFWELPYLSSIPFFGGIPAPLMDSCMKFVIGGELLTPHDLFHRVE